MKRTLLIIALVVLAVACGRVDTNTPTPGAPTITEPTPTPTAPGQEPVREVDYESIFKLQYCNYTIANLDYDVSRAKEEQEDAENALAKAQDELVRETESSTRAGIQQDIDEYRTTITNLQKEATAKSAKLAETISKCNSLERRKDSAICNAFLADAQVQLSASKATLAAEQEDLDQAIANNIQSRILKNQRKVAKAQAAATKMQAIYDELQVHCR